MTSFAKKYITTKKITSKQSPKI